MRDKREWSEKGLTQTEFRKNNPQDFRDCCDKIYNKCKCKIEGESVMNTHYGANGFKDNYNDFQIDMSSVEALFMHFGVPQSKMVKLFSNDSEKSSRSPKVVLNNIGLYIRRLENTFWLGLDDGIPEGYAMKLEREFNEAGIKFYLNGYPNKHIEEVA